MTQSKTKRPKPPQLLSPSSSSPSLITDISSSSSSFTFQKPILSIDWRALHAIDLDTAVDLSQLERGLPSLVLGDILSERSFCLTPLNFVCAFRTAQFALQYLLQVQDQLTKQLMKMREKEAQSHDSINNSNLSRLEEQQRLLILYKCNIKALNNKLHVMQSKRDTLTAELLAVQEQVAGQETMFAAKLELAKRSRQNHSSTLEGELSRVMSENLRLRRRVAEMAVAGDGSGTTAGRQVQQRKSDDDSGAEKAVTLSINSQKAHDKNTKPHPVPASPTRKQRQCITTSTTSPEVSITATGNSSADTDLDQDHCIERLKTTKKKKKKNLDSQSNAFYRPLHRGSEALMDPPPAAAATSTTKITSLPPPQQTKTTAPGSDQWKSLRNSVSIKRGWFSASDTDTYDYDISNTSGDNDDDDDDYNPRHSGPWAVSVRNVLTPEKRHPMPYLKNGTGINSNSNSIRK
jgi:hypothetical protein